MDPIDGLQQKIKLFPKTIFPLIIWFSASQAAWHQDVGNAQRTGYTPEEPELPWELAWTWNGPDENGGIGGHLYHQPQLYEPWEARTITGGGNLYAPANDQGLYALKLEDGSVSWRYDQDVFNITPAYDAVSGSLFAGSDNGQLYKIDVSSGNVTGTYSAGNKISKSILLANGFVYLLTDGGELHKVDAADMSGEWVYQGNSQAHTLPAYSASGQVIIFCTADLNVHCVNEADGSPKWKVKPSSATPGYPYEFQGGWPVIAEQHGLVFVRMNQGIGLIFGSGEWPVTNTEIRAKLESEPQWKNLFPLDLETGEETFIPAVGPQGVEDFGSSPNLRIHSFPVIKILADGKELAYSTWRNSDTEDPDWDPRWDSHLGEMVLDNTTVPGYAAGDLRFVEFQQHGSFIRITDEASPITMAGNTLFHAHWAGSEAARIIDRTEPKGSTQGNPISTEKLPPVVRSQRCTTGAGCSFSPSHYTTSCGLQYHHGTEADCAGGRWYGSPGWYVYWGAIDPPTPLRSAYSEGVLPRYTYVSEGYVVVEGNGGDLFVLKHSGEPLSSNSFNPDIIPNSNPVKITTSPEGSAQIKLTGPASGTVEIQVYTLTGKKVWNTTVLLIRNQPRIIIWHPFKHKNRIVLLQVKGAGINLTEKISLLE